MFIVLLCIHILLDVSESRPHLRSNTRILLSVPRRVPAVEGSCVLIPCSYFSSHPVRPLLKPMSYMQVAQHGVWTRGRDTVASTTISRPVAPAYRGRSRFVQRTQTGQCSMVLDPVQRSDAGSYHFHLVGFWNKSFSQQPVSVDVIAPPVPLLSVTLGKDVVASCSTTFHCKAHPPTISWSKRRPGLLGMLSLDFDLKKEQLSRDQWKITSIVRYPLTTDIFNKNLTCTATYHGGKKASTTTIVN